MCNQKKEIKAIEATNGRTTFSNDHEFLRSLSIVFKFAKAIKATKI